MRVDFNQYSDMCPASTVEVRTKNIALRIEFRMAEKRVPSSRIKAAAMLNLPGLLPLQSPLLSGKATVFFAPVSSKAGKLGLTALVAFLSVLGGFYYTAYLFPECRTLGGLRSVSPCIQELTNRDEQRQRIKLRRRDREQRPHTNKVEGFGSRARNAISLCAAETLPQYGAKELRGDLGG